MAFSSRSEGDKSEGDDDEQQALKDYIQYFKDQIRKKPLGIVKEFMKDFLENKSPFYDKLLKEEKIKKFIKRAKEFYDLKKIQNWEEREEELDKLVQPEKYEEFQKILMNLGSYMIFELLLQDEHVKDLNEFFKNINLIGELNGESITLSIPILENIQKVIQSTLYKNREMFKGDVVKLSSSKQPKSLHFQWIKLENIPKINSLKLDLIKLSVSDIQNYTRRLSKIIDLIKNDLMEQNEDSRIKLLTDFKSIIDSFASFKTKDLNKGNINSFLEKLKSLNNVISSSEHSEKLKEQLILNYGEYKDLETKLGKSRKLKSEKPTKEKKNPTLCDNFIETEIKILLRAINNPHIEYSKKSFKEYKKSLDQKIKDLQKANSEECKATKILENLKKQYRKLKGEIPLKIQENYEECAKTTSWPVFEFCSKELSKEIESLNQLKDLGIKGKVGNIPMTAKEIELLNEKSRLEEIIKTTINSFVDQVYDEKFIKSPHHEKLLNLLKCKGIEDCMKNLETIRNLIFQYSNEMNQDSREELIIEYKILSNLTLESENFNPQIAELNKLNLWTHKNGTENYLALIQGKENQFLEIVKNEIGIYNTENETLKSQVFQIVNQGTWEKFLNNYPKDPLNKNNALNTLKLYRNNYKIMKRIIEVNDKLSNHIKAQNEFKDRLTAISKYNPTVINEILSKYKEISNKCNEIYEKFKLNPLSEDAFKGISDIESHFMGKNNEIINLIQESLPEIGIIEEAVSILNTLPKLPSLEKVLEDEDFRKLDVGIKELKNILSDKNLASRTAEIPNLINELKDLNGKIQKKLKGNWSLKENVGSDFPDSELDENVNEKFPKGSFSLKGQLESSESGDDEGGDSLSSQLKAQKKKKDADHSSLERSPSEQAVIDDANRQIELLREENQRLLKEMENVKKSKEELETRLEKASEKSKEESEKIKNDSNNQIEKLKEQIQNQKQELTDKFKIEKQELTDKFKIEKQELNKQIEIQKEQFENQNQALNKKIKDSNENFESIQNSFQIKESEWQKFKDSHNQELISKNQEHSLLKEQFEKIKLEKNDIQGKFDQIKKESNGKNEQLEKFKTESIENQNQIKELNLENEKIKTESVKIQSKLNESLKLKNDEIENLKSKIEFIEKDKESLQKQKESMERKREFLGNEIQKANESLISLQNEKDSLISRQTENEKLNQIELSKYQNLITKLEEQQKTIKDELIQKTNQITELTEEQTRQNQENQNKLEIVKNELISKKKENSNLQSQVAILSSEGDKTKQQTTLLALANQNLENVNSKLLNLETEKMKCIQDLNNSKKDQEICIKEKENLQIDNNKLIEKRKEIETKNDDCIKERDNLQIINKDYNQKITKLETESKSLSDQRDNLQKENNSCISSRDKINLELETCNKEKIQFEIGKNDCIKKRDNLETENMQLIEKRKEIEISNNQLIENANKIKETINQNHEKFEKLKNDQNACIEEKKELLINQEILTNEKIQFEMESNACIQEKEKLAIDHDECIKTREEIQRNHNDCIEKYKNIQTDLDKHTKEIEKIQIDFDKRGNDILNLQNDLDKRTIETKNLEIARNDCLNENRKLLIETENHKKETENYKNETENHKKETENYKNETANNKKEIERFTQEREKFKNETEKHIQEREKFKNEIERFTQENKNCIQETEKYKNAKTNLEIEKENCIQKLKNLEILDNKECLERLNISQDQLAESKKDQNSILEREKICNKERENLLNSINNQRENIEKLELELKNTKGSNGKTLQDYENCIKEIELMRNDSENRKKEIIHLNLINSLREKISKESSLSIGLLGNGQSKNDFIGNQVSMIVKSLKCQKCSDSLGESQNSLKESQNSLKESQNSLMKCSDSLKESQNSLAKCHERLLTCTPEKFIELLKAKGIETIIPIPSLTPSAIESSSTTSFWSMTDIDLYNYLSNTPINNRGKFEIGRGGGSISNVFLAKSKVLEIIRLRREYLENYKHLFKKELFK